MIGRNMLKDKHIILYLIVFFALVLRLYGINFEVPHPDDYITVQGAMHFGLANVTPTGYGLYGLYVWPAFFMVDIQLILFTLYFFIGWAVGIFPSIEVFRNYYITDPSSFYLIGRIMCISFGTGTVWILYYMGVRLYNHKVGLLAALFLSVSFIHSFHSQFIRPDVPSTFLIVLVMLFSMMIYEQKNMKFYVYAGIITGLSVATKFTSAIVLVPILAAHIMAEGKDLLHERTRRHAEKNRIPVILITVGIFLSIGSLLTLKFVFPLLEGIHFSSHPEVNSQFLILLDKLMYWGAFLGIGLVLLGGVLIYFPTATNIILNLLTSKKLLYCTVAVVISFFAFDPLFFLDFKNQLRILLTDPNFMGKNNLFVGVDSLGFFGNLLWYLKGPLNWGSGLHFEIMAGLGLLLTLYRKRREDFIILSFVFFYFIVIGFGKFKWERYIITLMPFVALYAGMFLHTLIGTQLLSKTSANTKNTFLLCITLVLIALPTINIVRYDYLLTQKDTRVIAKEWVEKNIPPGSKVGQDSYTGELSHELFQVTKMFSISSTPFTYYRENGYQYLLVSDTQYKRYLAEPDKYPGNVEFYKNLFAECKLIKEVKPRDDLWPEPNDRFTKYHIHISPRIRIYKIS
ncbi:MAG: glycosyltransferase family 39 protein [Thermodesulfobacteriota bacterium]|nr:glycosyltransferase family 39 protein [Thermodesulfobacteriota bacterium]